MGPGACAHTIPAIAGQGPGHGCQRQLGASATPSLGHPPPPPPAPLTMRVVYCRALSGHIVGLLDPKMLRIKLTVIPTAQQVCLCVLGTKHVGTRSIWTVQLHTDKKKCARGRKCCPCLYWGSLSHNKGSLRAQHHSCSRTVGGAPHPRPPCKRMAHGPVAHG